MTADQHHDFESIKSHMARGAAWMVAMRWSLRAVGLINIAILARLLAPEDFGLVAMAMVVYGLFEMLSDANVDLPLIRMRQPSRADYDTAWTIQLMLGTGLTVLLMAAAPLIAVFFGDPRITLVVQIVALRGVILGLLNIGTVDFRRDFDFAKEFRFGVWRQLSAVAINLAIVLALRDYLALAIAVPVSAAVAVVLSYRMSPYRPRLSLARCRRIWPFSQWLIVYYTAEYAADRGDELLVGRIAGAAALGHYSFASQIAVMPVRELVAPVVRALMPTTAKIAHDRAAIGHAFRTVSGLLAVLCLAISVGMALVADDLVVVVLGEQWRGAAPIFRWLCLYAAAAGLIRGLQPFFVMVGRERAYAVLAAVQLALLVPVLLAAALHSVEAIALARAAVAGAMVPVIFFAVTRIGPVDGAAVRAVLWRPLCATAAMVLAVLAVQGGHADLLAVDSWGTAPGGAFDPAAVMRLGRDAAVGAAAFAAALFALWALAGRPDGAERILLAAAGRLGRRAQAPR
jgi:O-antigen/teichoic acid export membrane protein